MEVSGKLHTLPHYHFTPWKEPHYSLNKGLGELQSQRVRGGEEQYYGPVQEFAPRTVQPLAVITPTMIL